MADLITRDDCLQEEDPKVNQKKSDTTATVIQPLVFR